MCISLIIMIDRTRAVFSVAITAIILEVFFFIYALGSFLASSHGTITFGGVVVAAAGVLIFQSIYFWQLIHTKRHQDYRWHSRVEFYPIAILSFFTVALVVSWVLTLFQSFSVELWDAVRDHTTGWVRFKLTILAMAWILLAGINWTLALFHHHGTKTNVLIVREGEVPLTNRFIGDPVDEELEEN